jgi:predicted glycogen debranching enzyme
MNQVIDFGRDWCGDFAISGNREWLVTNGIGGYACGTVAGQLSRRYHGLLIAALQPPVGRRLLVTRLEETANYAGGSYKLFTQHYPDGEVRPRGFIHLERFHLEGTTPVWTFALAEALLEKRIWMAPGENTTYVRYDLHRAAGPVELALRVQANDRDHHEQTRAGGIQIQTEKAVKGLRLTGPGNVPFYLLGQGLEFTADPSWQMDHFLSVEAYRGLPAVEDHFSPGLFLARLQPGGSLTLVASTRPDPVLDGQAAYQERQAYERSLVEQSGRSLAPGWLQQLVLAADQFIVRRPSPGEPEGRSIIAGYPWFGDWGRDTMISLPGLALSTGRFDVARSVLRTFARFTDRGMLPNNFPEAGETPGYNTVDATLWYFEALRAYLERSDDLELLRELFPILQEIIAWHRRGTRYGIRIDPQDGLLYAGEPGVQLTWMDVKIGDWVVTPRTGKPVEVNALWYNALISAANFAVHLGEPSKEFRQMAKHARASFQRFWNPSTGYCYDVIDGPERPDPGLRPNQLFAVSLPASPLEPEQQRGVVDACARHLLTSHGLRSLAPLDAAGRRNPDYHGVYGGDRQARDAAYHQGTVWGWLIGPFVLAHLRVYRDAGVARSFLRPLVQQLASHGLGTLSEIFDGDPPFTPRGCIAQAWSVAEVLRAWEAIEQVEQRQRQE